MGSISSQTVEDRKRALKLSDALNALTPTNGSNSVWIIGRVADPQTLICKTPMTPKERSESYKQLRMCKWSEKIKNINRIANGRKNIVFSTTNKERDTLIVFGYLRQNKSLLSNDVANICLHFYLTTDIDFYTAGMNDYGHFAIGYEDLDKLNVYNVFTKVDAPPNVSKVCSGSYGYSLFWITHDGLLYANGNNNCNQLGLQHKQNVFKPTKLKFFEDRNLKVVDAASSYTFNLVLCENGIVWFAGRFSYGGYQMANRNTWMEVIELKGHFIVSVKTAGNGVFFLEDDGNVWGCGCNLYGQLGNGQTSNKNGAPTRIQYFEENHIRITKIECGNIHNMALDTNGKVYCWGYDALGSCGVGYYKDRGTINVIRTPTLVESLRDKVVIDIKCSERLSSAAITQDGEIYVWGSSPRNCLFQSGPIFYPKCINRNVYDITGCDEIIDMALYGEATWFVVKNAKFSIYDVHFARLY